MTIEPISDERLAEIRAGYDRIARRLFIAANMMASNPLFPRGESRDELKDDLRDAAHLVRALLSRLDKAEAGWQDEAKIAAARERAEALGPGMPGIMRTAFADIAENAIRQYFRPLPPPPSSES